MGSRKDPAALRQYASALSPGCVIHCYQPVAGKPKYHVLIAVGPDRSVGFIINSRPSPFIEKRRDLLKRQVSMLKQLHPFMHHDSFIACHDPVRMPTRDELVDGLCNGEIETVGRVAESIFGEIALAAEGSPSIAPRDAELIAKAFARKVKNKW